MSIDITTMNKQELEVLLAALEKRVKGIVFPDIGDKEKPMGTLDNFRVLLNHYGIVIRYNEMTKENEIDIPGDTSHADIAANAKFAKLVDLANKHRFPKGDVDLFVTKVGAENSYHPVRDWIDSKEWDGQDRLQEFYDSLELATEHPLKETMLRKWAISCVAALYYANFSCEGVLTLSGRQGIGKSTFVRQLLPVNSINWYKDGVHLDFGIKDTLFKALSAWITELGEIDTTFKRSEISQLKAFITEREDILRPPYERKSNRYARRTLFFGTVNAEEFLNDDENRRFWVLDVRAIHTITFDIQQFWAQIKILYQRLLGRIETKALREQHDEWGWFLSPEERRLLGRNQQQFKTVDPIEEILSNHIDLKASVTECEWMNVTEILQKLNIDKPSRADTNTGAKWLRKNGIIPNRIKKYNVKISEAVLRAAQLQEETQEQLRIFPNLLRRDRF